MRKLLAALSAVLLVFSAGCGQYDTEPADSQQSVSETQELHESTEAAETIASAEPEEVPDETDEIDDTNEEDDAPVPVGGMPEDTENQVAGQLAALQAEDFDQWAECIDFDTVMDMMSEDIDPDEDDAQALYWIMAELAESFGRAAQTLPAEFAALDAQDISVSEITFEKTEQDGGVPADLYRGTIDGTEMLVKFAVYHYGGKDIPWVYDVVYDEPIDKDTAQEAAKMVYRAAMSSLPNGEADLADFPEQYIDCSDFAQELTISTGDGTTYGFGYMLSKLLDGLEPKGQAYITTMKIADDDTLVVQWRADENSKTVAQYPVNGSRKVITWGEAEYYG